MIGWAELQQSAQKAPQVCPVITGKPPGPGKEPLHKEYQKTAPPSQRKAGHTVGH